METQTQNKPRTLEEYVSAIEANINNPLFQGLIDAEREYIAERRNLTDFGKIEELGIRTIERMDNKTLEKIAENPILMIAYWARKMKEKFTAPSIENSLYGGLSPYMQSEFPVLTLTAYATGNLDKEDRRKFLQNYLDGSFGINGNAFNNEKYSEINVVKFSKAKNEAEIRGFKEFIDNLILREKKKGTPQSEIDKLVEDYTVKYSMYPDDRLVKVGSIMGNLNYLESPVIYTSVWNRAQKFKQTCSKGNPEGLGIPKVARVLQDKEASEEVKIRAAEIAGDFYSAFGNYFLPHFMEDERSNNNMKIPLTGNTSNTESFALAERIVSAINGKSSIYQIREMGNGRIRIEQN